MDPDFYRTGGLPTSLNRYPAEISSLLAEQSQTIAPGLGLPSSFPSTTLTSAAARSFGPLPGYAGHSLHGLQTQLTDNHLQNIAAQGPYKTIPQGSYTMPDPYVGLRLSTQASTTGLSKPLFAQDATIAQSPTLDIAQKHWGLSNFVSPSSLSSGNPFGLLPSDLSNNDVLAAISSQQSPAPPPAHSSKHSSALQLTSYSPDDMFPGRNTKSPLQRPSTYEYRAPSSVQPNVISQANPLLSFTPDVSFHSKTEQSAFSDMKYEAVSPAPSDGQQNASSEQYHVSLQDLASISSTREKLVVDNTSQKPRQIMEETRQIEKRGPVQMQQDLYTRVTPNGQISQMKQNPSQQQQPVGGSPQTPVSLGSPPMPSSTFVTAPLPVQAQADSTTKPKRSRSRKKKEPVTVVEPKKEAVTVYPERVLQYNQQIINPAVRDQPFSTSSDVIQRNSGNQYVVNQQTFMQNPRTSQSMDNIQQNPQSKPAAPDINRSAQPIKQPQFKNESSPSMTQPSPASAHQMSPMTAPQQSPMAAPQQSPLAGPQQSPMMVRFQSPSPMSSQSGAQYSVSDALEMNREAMFAGYNGSEMNSYPMPESFTSQLSMQRPDAYGANEGPYSAEYGGQFVSPNNVLAVEIHEVPTGPASTIDEGAFASLMDESYDPSQQQFVKTEFGQDPYANFPLTVNPSDQDDEFCHLAQAPKEKKSDNIDFTKKIDVKTEPIAQPLETPKPPPTTPRMDIKAAAGGSSFMDSYLNFLQGKKPETLSSMSSAIIQNKPQLPKYIPEPRRPRPVEVPKETPKSDDSRTNSPKRDIVSKSETRPVSKPSVITFSDDEEDHRTNSQITSAVKSAISNLTDVKNDNVKISTNKSGGLKMKINLLQVKSAEANAKKAKAAKSKKSPSKSKRKGKRADSSGEEDFGGGKEEESPEPEPVFQRESSARKAKQKKAKYTVDLESDSDSDTLKPINKKDYETEEQYDSDVDPAWTPVELSKKSSFDSIDLGERKKKSRSKPKSKVKSRRQSGEGAKSVSMPRTSLSQEDLDVLPPVAKTARVQIPEPTELSSDSEDERQLKSLPTVNGELQVGEFVMEKKDVKNYETYPIWKIESGRMLHKYELFAEESRILHRAIPTFSSWLPNMRNGFLPIKVRHIRKQGDTEYVEVIEDSRPKLQLDKQLEEKYEEHPLIDVFNVYLQIFLSQALEPGFLSAIMEEKDQFYLDALKRIDGDIARQIQDIESKVMWKQKFKEGLRLHPHIRELDRPNLKLSCQACEYASQPAIKSVHLFGNPYDRFTLQEQPVPGGAKPSLEFMVGKTAAHYIRPYHSLYHFKYNLYKRCLAKVNITKDSGEGKETDAILDQCLQNRAWVLQIFEDLKKMLEKG